MDINNQLYLITKSLKERLYLHCNPACASYFLAKQIKLFSIIQNVLFEDNVLFILFNNKSLYIDTIHL